MQLKLEPGFEGGKMPGKGKLLQALKVRNKPGAEGERNTGRTRTVKEIRPRNQPTNIYRMSLACPSPCKTYEKYTQRHSCHQKGDNLLVDVREILILKKN